jgi:hypothetical protein
MLPQGIPVYVLLEAGAVTEEVPDSNLDHADTTNEFIVVRSDKPTQAIPPRTKNAALM